MNQKNSLDLNACFKDTNDPFELFSQFKNNLRPSFFDFPYKLSFSSCEEEDIIIWAFEFVLSSEATNLSINLILVL